MFSKKKIIAVLKKVEALEKFVFEEEIKNKNILKKLHTDHIHSGRNLIHYLALRAKDLRSLQAELSELGISSFGHSESYTFNNLKKIKIILSALAGIPFKTTVLNLPDAEQGKQLLKRNSEQLFGKMQFRGQTKIMVTLPTEASDDYLMVLNFIKAGMNIVRINTAHDNHLIWEKMIANVRKAEQSTGKRTKIYMDLEGPKIRTGKVRTDFKKTRRNKEKKPCIKLRRGSSLYLTRKEGEEPGGKLPFVSISYPEIFRQVKSGESIWFDDGKLGGIIRAATEDKILIEITHAPEKGFKLKSEKGINFPDSQLNIPALTAEDLDHLKFVARYADMVGFSFVQHPEDILELQKNLRKLKREDLGIILKIETRLAFDNLPYLLFTAKRSLNCGVMIARGDLAVEIGYLRIAEVQEEILWFSEAAHVPVIWATQVLDTQVKTGSATRAEISDVVKAVRAECVMLNKGPHIMDAIKIVKDIDKRMAAHEDKKRKILRSLHVAKDFIE